MLHGTRIAGVGAYVPERRLTNQELSQMVDTTDEWILTRTGIAERRIAAPGEGTSHLGARAAQEAIADAGLKPEEIDLIIVATCTPDLTFPPVASLIQGMIGATKAATFDLNGVCAGFLQALVTGAQFIHTGAYRHVLIIGAETYSRILDYTDRATCILFGDGAGAVVLSRGAAGEGLIDFTLHADGTGAKNLYCPSPTSPASILADLEAEAKPFVWQNGRVIFRGAVTGMASSCRTVLERQSIGVDAVKVVVPHQANERIMLAVAEQLGLPFDRVANVVREYGNTSAATIPLALHRWVRTRGLNPGDPVVLCAYAGGLNWGAALLRWA